MVLSRHMLSFFNEMRYAFAHFTSAVCSFIVSIKRFVFKLISLASV